MQIWLPGGRGLFSEQLPIYAKSTSTALCASVLGAHSLVAKAPPLDTRMFASTQLQITAISILVTDLPQQLKHELKHEPKNLHRVSVRSCDSTKGVSLISLDLA